MTNPEVLYYQNLNVMHRYQKDYPNNQLPAHEAFAELMKFFWLCQHHSLEQKKNPLDESLHFSCVIHADMKEIDDMWHTFLLFTRDYMDFCQKYFGKYFHHAPNVDQNKPTTAVYERELRRYLSYIYTHLGEATLKKWFAKTLHERF